MANHRQKASVPPAMARADRDVQDVSTGVTDKEEGAVQTAPLQPSPSRGWFALTWHYLFITHHLNDPDEIVTFSHAPQSVTVRLANGREYCIDKGRL